MAVELRHLRCFVVVAEELHFHHAAKRLHVAQPALSRTIKSLEQELGVVLLRRSTRSVELTAAGAVFLDKARTALAMVDEATAVGRGLGQGSRGSVVVGGSTQLRQRVSQILHDFHREHPSVDVSKREDGTARLLAAVLDHEVDVGVGLVPERCEGVSYSAIGEDRLMLVVPDRHRFAGRASVSLSDLADETLLVPSDPNARAFKQLLEGCRAAGFEPRLLHRPTEHEEAFQSILEGPGVELRCWDFLSLRRTAGVCFVPIVPEETIVIEVFWRTDEANPAAQRFVEIATGQPFKPGPANTVSLA